MPREIKFRVWDKLKSLMINEGVKMSGISKGVVYEFETKEGIKIGIFEGKVIKFSPETIVQLRDIKEEGVLYNVKMEILKEMKNEHI